MNKEIWPELNFKEGKETYETIHLWTQIVGKIKLSRLPWMNHSWHVTLLVTPSGLTTGDLPDIEKHFQINFNFRKHELQIITSKDESRNFSLPGLSVAGFYRKMISTLSELDIKAVINLIPNEIENATRFNTDEKHATYIPEVATRLHLSWLAAHEVFTQFRAGFIGKCSPVHFFWGGFDLAVSRFSGRDAPKHPGGVPNFPDWVAREAYSHEVSSSGFWPGSDALPFAAFYSYIYPEPLGYETASVKPPEAYYNHDFGEFILPYETVQKAVNPTEVLLEFLTSTYEAAADLAKWDRGKLEKQFGLKK